MSFIVLTTQLPKWQGETDFASFLQEQTAKLIIMDLYKTFTENF